MNSTDPTGTSSTERRVARHLESNAQILTVGDTPLSAVIKRGRQRRARRRTGVGVLSVATVTTGAIVSINLLSEPAGHKRLTTTYGDNTDGSTVETDGGVTEVVNDATTTATEASASDNAAPSSDPPPTVAPLTTIPSNLAWNAVTPDSSEAIVTSGLGRTGSAPYIAVSTAPGIAATPDGGIITQLYTSNDGINWKPVGADPGVDRLPLDGYDGVLYSFGTAALTAEIPAGRAGDVVVQTSSDEGSTWNPEVLPLDLRALSAERGVKNTPFNFRNISAGPVGVIAVGQVYIELDFAELGLPVPQPFYEYNRTAGGVEIGNDGCGTNSNGGVTSTTMSAPTTPPEVTAVAPTVVPVNNSVPATASPTETTLACPPVTLGSNGGTSADPTFYAWADLGVSQTVVDALSTPAYVFIKPTGATEFIELPFPTIPAGCRLTGATATALDDGFAIVANFGSDDNKLVKSHLYRSSDGSSWSDVELPIYGVSSINQLPDGTFVGYGNTSAMYTASGGGSAVIVSSDGINWTTTDLDGILTDADGESARLMMGTNAIGSSGITIAAQIYVDPWKEGGPVSSTKDGVVVSILDQTGELVFTDEATGEELGRWRNEGRVVATNVTQDGQTGDYQLLNEDGSVRVTFTSADVDGLHTQIAGRYPTRVVILHSRDGYNWSREDVSEIAGFPVEHVNGVQSAADKVLVTVVDRNTLNDLGRPTTVVLVGTPKS